MRVIKSEFVREREMERERDGERERDCKPKTYERERETG